MSADDDLNEPLAASDASSAVPIGDALAGLEIPSLDEGVVPIEAFSLVKVRNADGDVGWSVRVTADLDDDELLGTLVSYVDHLTRTLAKGWDESDPTRPS